MASGPRIAIPARGYISAAHRGLIHDRTRSHARVVQKITRTNGGMHTCTNPVSDSSYESGVVAEVHEQTDNPDIQDHELARL